ncbi:MAG: hypothetical protein R2702_09860 [Acidimicrobiales bacterium]
MQDVLLGLGTALVAVAVTVFAAVNWRRLDATAQGLALVALTGALGAIAARAGRRGLRATAEAFASAAILLALADVHAFRVGLAPQADVRSWWAVGLLGVAGLAVAVGSAARARGAVAAATVLAQVALPVAVVGRTSTVVAAVAVIVQSTVAVVALGGLRGARLRPARWVGRAAAVALAVGAELATSSAALLALAEGDPVPVWWAVAAAGAVLLTALAVELRARPEVRDGSLSLAVGHLLVATLGAATSAFGWDGGAPIAVVAGVAAIGLLGAGRLPRPWSGAPTATFAVGLGLASLPVVGAVATALIAASEVAGRPWSLDGATTAADLALQPVGVATRALLGHLAALLVGCLALGRAPAGADAPARRGARARAGWGALTVLLGGLLLVPVLAPVTIAQVVLGALAIQVAAVAAGALVGARGPRRGLVVVALVAQGWALAWGAAAAELTLQALLVSAASMALALVAARRRDLAGVALAATGWLGVGVPLAIGLAALASGHPGSTGWAAAAVAGAMLGAIVQLLLDGARSRSPLDRQTVAVGLAASATVHGLALVATAGAGALDALAVVLAAGTIALVVHGTRPERQVLLVAAGLEGLALTWLLLARQDVGLVEAYTLPLAGLLLVLGAAGARLRAAGPVPRGGRPDRACSWPWARPWSWGSPRADRCGRSWASSPAVLAIGGAGRGRRAPFDIGVGAVGALALQQGLAMVGALPNWATIGTTGLVLLAVGATFEQRRADLRSARRAYASLR